MSTLAATIPDPFEHVKFRGKPMDAKTREFLLVLESRLGYRLTVTQAHNVGYGPSGGTHDGYGVVDLTAFEADRKVREAIDLGGFAWHRPAIKGLWPEHVHLGIIDHGRLSPAAYNQQLEFLATPPGDGLKGETPDPNPYRPHPPVVFDYRAAVRDAHLRARVAGIRARIKTLRDRISTLRRQIRYK